MDQSEKERESKCCCSSLIKSEMSSRCERKTVRGSIDMRTLDLFDIECCKLADIFFWLGKWTTLFAGLGSGQRIVFERARLDTEFYAGLESNRQRKVMLISRDQNFRWKPYSLFFTYFGNFEKKIFCHFRQKLFFLLILRKGIVIFSLKLSGCNCNRDMNSTIWLCCSYWLQ